MCVPAASAAATSSGDVVSDGERWAAWPTSPAEVVAYDDRTQRRRRISVPECPLAAVGSGRLLVSCPGGPVPRPVVIDIRTGVRTELTGVESIWHFHDPAQWVGVGRRGILGTVSGSHYRVESGYDAAAGVLRTLDDRRRATDLDEPDLSRPLCAPLRRTVMPEDPADQEARDPYVPMLYARPWGAESVPDTRPFMSGVTEDARVRVWRCGRSRPVVLSRRCGCTAQLGAGLVTWRHRDWPVDPRRVHAVDLASGRRRSWRVGEEQSVAQAGRTMVVWTSTPGATSRSIRLIRWPRPR